MESSRIGQLMRIKVRFLQRTGISLTSANTLGLLDADIFALVEQDMTTDEIIDRLLVRPIIYFQLRESIDNGMALLSLLRHLRKKGGWNTTVLPGGEGRRSHIAILKLREPKEFISILQDGEEWEEDDVSSLVEHLQTFGEGSLPLLLENVCSLHPTLREESSPLGEMILDTMRDYILRNHPWRDVQVECVDAEKGEILVSIYMERVNEE